MPVGRGVSGGMTVTCAGSGRMQRQVGGQALGPVSVGRSRLWKVGGLGLTEHSEIGRSCGRVRKAIAGNAGILAGVIRLSGLQPQASVYQDPHSRLQAAARWPA